VGSSIGGRARFDRDELGLDPEEDQDEEEVCPTCRQLVEECICDDEEE